MSCLYVVSMPSISSMPFDRDCCVWGVLIEPPMPLGSPAYHPDAGGTDTLPNWKGRVSAFQTCGIDTKAQGTGPPADGIRMGPVSTAGPIP